MSSSDLLEALRPALHRYCARMTGSVIDGEDVVQIVLAHAHAQLPQLRDPGALRSWLFRIAHTRSLNYIAARGRRVELYAVPLDDAEDVETGEPAADAQLERSELLHAAIDAFLVLPPMQRACVILKDILDASLEDIATSLDRTVPAVKAALHRGRANLAGLRERPVAPPGGVHSPALVRYVTLFNARDWDGVRTMLSEDVKLDLVSREQREGVIAVSGYFSNYERSGSFHLAPAWLDGREVIAVRRASTEVQPTYVIALQLSVGRVVHIRDYRYVPYLLADIAL